MNVVKEKGLLHLSGVTADKITELLAQRHKDDVYVSQCKNGETWGARDLLKLDAWVLLKTYSPFTTIGYEIKVSRQDFEHDNKWNGYLDLCHQFYFVCPAGLIREIDLPSQIGLIWVSNTGKLYTKRKALRTEPNLEHQFRLLVYILMSRAKIDVKDNNDISRLEFLKQEVIKANERKELAYFVKGHVRDIYNKVQNIEITLSNREYQVKQFTERLSKLGIIWDYNSNNWIDIHKVESEIDLLKQRID
jgi:hypothetical protein